MASVVASDVHSAVVPRFFAQKARNVFFAMYAGFEKFAQFLRRVVDHEVGYVPSIYIFTLAVVLSLRHCQTGAFNGCPVEARMTGEDIRMRYGPIESITHKLTYDHAVGFVRPFIGKLRIKVIFALISPQCFISSIRAVDIAFERRFHFVGIGETLSQFHGLFTVYNFFCTTPGEQTTLQLSFLCLHVSATICTIMVISIRGCAGAYV